MSSHHPQLCVQASDTEIELGRASIRVQTWAWPSAGGTSLPSCGVTGTAGVTAGLCWEEVVSRSRLRLREGWGQPQP